MPSAKKKSNVKQKSSIKKSPPVASSVDGKEISRAKKYAFSFIAIVCIPTLFFLILEGGLRLVGVGTHYEYFEEIEINGEAYFQENKSFANQFYPPSLGVAPLDTTIEVNPNKDTVRVYILGGSAAQGFPHINHGLDRHLSAHLTAALPNKNIQIVNTAMTSVNSHVVYEVARTIPSGSADYAIILMGNNEVVGPYGPSTFSQNFLSSLTMIRTLQALKRTRTWQMISMLVEDLRPTSEGQALEWEGMQMFSQFNVKHDDSRLSDVYSHYNNNLRDMINILQDKGIHVILSSVPVNLRHSAPFGSQHKDDLTEADLNRWKQQNAIANETFERQDWEAARSLYSSLLEIDDEYADTYFRLATTLENLGDYKQAKTYYESALNYDTKRFRTNHIINNIINTVAADESGQNFSFVDSVAVFNEASQPYAPGWNLLHEHVHFDYDGNFYLAREMTQAIMTTAAPSVNFEPLDKEVAANMIGFPNHETNQVMERLLKMVSKPPFTEQSNHSHLETFTTQRKEQIFTEVGLPAQVIERRQPIVEQGLADWKLHYELAELNRFLRNTDAYFFHVNELIKLHLHNHESLINIAQALAGKADYQTANTYLKRSLHYTRNDPDKEVQALGLIGLNYMKTKDYDNGSLYFERIVNDYSNQIGAVFRAYGVLIKYAKEYNKTKAFNGYVNGSQRYATRLINDGRADEFPLIYRRMAQIMTIAGNTPEAQRWQTMEKEAKE